MKLMQAMTVVGVTILCTGIAFGEVVIRTTPLKWEQVAKLDSDLVFSNLCASCHGVSGKGDGPAVSALKTPVPDLTALAVKNEGEYPSSHVHHVINGRFRDDVHGAIGMPRWGEQFVYLPRSGPNTSYAWERVDSLNRYIESIQEY